MTGDQREWLDEAMAKCVKASVSGITVLFRNDDTETIVCSSTDPKVIIALGRSLACEFDEDAADE